MGEKDKVEFLISCVVERLVMVDDNLTLLMWHVICFISILTIFSSRGGGHLSLRLWNHEVSLSNR